MKRSFSGSEKCDDEDTKVRQAALDKVNTDYFGTPGPGTVGSGEPESSHLLPSSSNNIPLQPIKRHVKNNFIFHSRLSFHSF